MSATWSSPTKIISTAGNDWGPYLSPDKLELIFASDADMMPSFYLGTRASPQGPFAMMPLPTAYTPQLEHGGAFVSDDDTTLWYGTGTYATPAQDSDVFVATRAGRGSAFANDAKDPAFTTAASEADPDVSSDLLLMALAFDDHGSNGADIYIATRSTAGAVWSQPARVAELASASEDTGPTLGADNTWVLFSSNRSGSRKIYEAHRASVASPFDPPTEFAPTMSGGTYDDRDPHLTRDGNTLVFSRAYGTGDYDLYEIDRTCP
jgi:Tol biopolymer transport system component